MNATPSRSHVRVMHVISSWTMGGTERMLTHTIPYFDTNCFESCLTCFNSRSMLTEEWESAGIQVFHLDSDKSVSLQGIRRLVKLLKSWRPDVLCVYGLRANLMARIAAWYCRTPVLVTGQRGIEDWKTWREVLLERITSPLVDMYVGNSQACCDMLANRERIPQRQLTTIPNGIAFHPPSDLAERVARLRSDHGLPSDRSIVGTVGRLLPVKGQHDFIAAAKTVLDTHKDAYFVIVGEDRRDGELQATARELGISDHVYFAGYSKDVAVWLETFMVYVQPSLSEGMPVAVLEAMFMRRPVIATRVGGTPEVVYDGVTGLLVPAKQPEKMAQAIVELLDDPERRDVFAQAGYERACARFTVDIMVRRYQELFDQLLSKKSGR